MTTTYIPTDGDFDPDRVAEYTQLIDDIQTAAGFDLGQWTEIHLFIYLNGIHFGDHLVIDVSDDDESEAYEHKHINQRWEFDFPPGYSRDQLIDLLPATVYLTPKPFTNRKS